MLALTILGNNSALPAFDRSPTAQVLQTAEESYLIDCGEGTQLQMMKYKIRRSRIHRIFISHPHGDHYFDWSGLSTAWACWEYTGTAYSRAKRPGRHPETSAESIRHQTLLPPTFSCLKREEQIVDDKGLL